MNTKSTTNFSPKLLDVARKLAGGANVASTIYGTVVTIAVIGAWYADKTSGSLETLLSVLVTLIILWVAHSYSHLVASGFERTKIISVFAHDWPLVQASFPSLLILGLGEVGIIGERLSLLLAILMAGIVLGFFCFSLARAAGRNWIQSIALGTLMLSLGILVALIEILLE